ncbi:methyltransferase domain-containing protein [Magnetovibrio sp. PR-2]|uniref:methyltransferase domain-containing protein n=1 Tax=Magnetovibrio sp. PR-2 TaxID=3120356 RepID=UPI002FCE3F0C
MSAQKSQIVDAFSKSADSYEQASQVQAQVAAQVAALALDGLVSAPDVLEIGCGTGGLTRHLLTGTSGGRFVITDIAPNMVDKCKTQCADPRVDYLCMDGERPSLEGRQFDLIVSSLAVQWFADLQAGLAELAGLLKPGGQLLFSTLGCETFANWRAAHAALGLKDGTRSYPDLTEIEALMPSGGSVVLWEERIERAYDDAHVFARRLKTIGANTPASGHKPLSPKDFRRISAHLGENFTDSYHIVYACFIKS